MASSSARRFEAYRDVLGVYNLKGVSEELEYFSTTGEYLLTTARDQERNGTRWNLLPVDKTTIKKNQEGSISRDDYIDLNLAKFTSFMYLDGAALPPPTAVEWLMDRRWMFEEDPSEALPDWISMEDFLEENKLLVRGLDCEEEEEEEDEDEEEEEDDDDDDDDRTHWHWDPKIYRPPTRSPTPQPSWSRAPSPSQTSAPTVLDEINTGSDDEVEGGATCQRLPSKHDKSWTPTDKVCWWSRYSVSMATRPTQRPTPAPRVVMRPTGF